MPEIIIRILYAIGGFFLGAVVIAIFALAEKGEFMERMNNMRNCSNRQDDAMRRRDNTVRLKQARIDELEREARSVKRRR